MNSGTAEQEQNGVTVPSNAASTLPVDSRLTGENPPRPFRREKRPHDADAKHDQHEQHQHLGGFKDKNSTVAPRCEPFASPHRE